MKKSLFCVFSTILFLIVYLSNDLFAQGWDRPTICPTCYPGSNLLYTPDGGLFTGSASAVKLDSAGRLEWKTDNVYGLNSLLTSQNEYLVCGFYHATQQAFVKKINSSGTIVWEKRYGQAGSKGNSIVEESPGQYLISGRFASGVTMIMINDNGDSLWSNIPRVYTHDEGILIRKSVDQNYLSLTNIMNSTDQIVQKIDRLTGDTVWTKKTNNVVWHLDSTSNGYVGSGGMLQKYDFNFNLVWMPQSPVLRNKEMYIPSSSVVMPSGNIMTIGNTMGSSNAIFMVKYSSNGIKIWEKAVQMLKDGSQPTKIIMMGPDHFGIAFNEGRYMKTDTLGETATNYISGRVIFDENSNCTVDPGEKASLHQEIFFEPGHLKLYINSDGYYVVPADTGTVTISIGSPNSIWDADVCGSSTKTITLNTFYTNSENNDFLLTPAKSCSRLNVDVAPTLLRRCFQLYY